VAAPPLPPPSGAPQVRHCALSLVGEPIMYPEINALVDLLHARHISTFLVTNAQVGRAQGRGRAGCAALCAVAAGCAARRCHQPPATSPRAPPSPHPAPPPAAPKSAPPPPTPHPPLGLMQFPERIRQLRPITQLYVSVDAATPESLKAVDRPLFSDYWQRFTDSLSALADRRQRTVYRWGGGAPLVGQGRWRGGLAAAGVPWGCLACLGGGRQLPRLRRLRAQQRGPRSCCGAAGRLLPAPRLIDTRPGSRRRHHTATAPHPTPTPPRTPHDHPSPIPRACAG
jgi:hypothetical protein